MNTEVMPSHCVKLTGWLNANTDTRIVNNFLVMEMVIHTRGVYIGLYMINIYIYIYMIIYVCILCICVLFIWS